MPIGTLLLKRIKPVGPQGWFWFLLVVGLSLVLALPNFDIHDYRLETASGTSTTTTSSATEIVVDNSDSTIQWGASLAAHLTGINLIPFQTQICLSNKNEILFNGEVQNVDELPDGQEAGAMSIPLKDTNGQSIGEIYAPKDKTNCRIVSSKVVMEAPILRNAYPVGKAQAIIKDNHFVGLQFPVYSDEEVDISATRISDESIFSLKIYLLNIAFCFFAIIVVIEILKSFFHLIKNK